MSQSKQRCFNTFVDTYQMFSNLNSKTQNQLQSIASTKEIDEGVFFGHTSIFADGVYLIVNGAARASTLDKDGNQLYVSTSSSGEIYGLFPVMSEKPDIHMIQAISPITALFLPAGQFRKIVYADRQLCEQVIKFICNWLKYFSDLANRFSLMKPIDRITHCLADIAPVYLRLGGEESFGNKINY